MDFETLGLQQSLIAGLAAQNIIEPTAVQAASFPLIVEGKDVMLQSQTGTGKTFAYLLPLYQRMLAVEPVEKGAFAMILVPTRELAMQIHHAAEELSKNSDVDIASVPLFGNVNINGQIEKLRQKPQILVGTGERMLNLIEKKKLPAHLVKVLVIDEADKLLDPQSIDLVRSVRKTLMKRTQMVFASATYCPKAMEYLKGLAPEAVVAQPDEKDEIPANIDHVFMVTQTKDKVKTVCRLIGKLHPEKALIFINELTEIDAAVEEMNRRGINCAAIHSETTKEERKHRLANFQSGKLPYLVATDLAARGLHVEGVDYIFHVNVAEDPTDYLHRAGRTGRNGTHGISLVLPTAQELTFLGKYKSRFGIELEERALIRGELLAGDSRELRKNLKK
ncbi:DEAD/DEAH box helicase [Bengtsoniella intestinalis]|uniref:DEAD/DEAH box helicase n=1 Tax=Bengtsoniella intestinalis TaxID=3073143 RepID=UPI00391F2C3D